MATRFAIATGNWSNTAIWDNGALPTSADTVHPNGFTVTIDQDITIDGFNNNISAVYLPGMPIPKMTSNTQPSGTAFAGQNSSDAWKAFDQDGNTAAQITFWASTNLTNCSVGYQFTSGKIIKRYWVYRGNYNQRPTSWTFEGSNDGTTYTVLETVTANTATTSYLSGVLANTTSYTYYRINITAVSSGTVAYIYGLEMTESTATTYGTTTGGSFTVPASLSGSRNIVQNGAGIISNGTNTVITTTHTSGNTVNFNVSGGGYIFNSLWFTNQSANLRGVSIDGTGTVNFNGDILGSTQSNAYTQGGQIYINAAATVNINGNITAPIGSSSGQSNQINMAASGSILNITGNLIGSTGFVNAYNIYTITNNTTINITGNITSNIGICVFSSATTTVNIPTGTVTVTNNNSNPAIYMTSNLSLLTLNSPIINKGNANAVVAFRLRFYSTGTPYWVFQNNLNADITLAYGSATGSYPNEADVRFGTTYAASPTRTGTLRVPLPQYVSQGVLTDNTVGTAYLSATDVWNVLTTNITTVGSIGERLKNASTVQTTGDQLASYIV